MSANTITNERLNTSNVARVKHPRWQNILFWSTVLALLIVAIAMRLYQLGVPFDRDGYDEGVYWQSLRAMSAGFALYHQIFYSQPPFFLLSTYSFFALFGSTLWSARFAIALVSLFGLPGAYLLGKSLGGRVGAMLALVLIIVDPIYLAQSQTIEAEVSSAAFSLLSVGAAYLWWDNPEGTQGLFYVIVCGVTLSLGILCKLLSFSCLVPIGLLMLARLWQVWRKQSGQPTTTIVRGVVVGAIACIVTFAVLIIPFIGTFHDMLQGVVAFHTRAGVVFSRQPGMVGFKEQFLITFTHSYFMLIFAAFLGTLVALLRRNWKVVPLLAWLLVSLYLLWITTPLFYRHLIALVPPLIGLAVLGLEGLPMPVEKNGIVAKIVPALALLLLLGAVGLNARQNLAYYGNVAQQNNSSYTRLEARVATDLRNSIAPNQMVITDAQFIAALANRSTPPSLVDTSTVRIDSGYLTLQQLEDAAAQPDVHAVLFFTNRLTLHDVAPFHAWVAQHFHLKYTYGPGQELWVR